MKIALVMPKSTFLEDPLVFMPLGLMYLAARLESLGHTTEFFDLNVDEFPPDEFDQIWVSATSPQMQEIKRIGKILRWQYKARSVLGGASVWANPESCKFLGYDLIVGGEADSPDGMSSLFQHLEEYKHSAFEHLVVPVSKSLDWALPPVRRWSRKYHSYLTDLDGNRRDCTTMFTSRGCPLECAFCIAEGQRVLMADMTYVNIENVQVGDMVMGLHEGKTSGYYIAPTKVLNTMNNGIRETIKIDVANSSLRCTPDHKIYVDDGHKTRWKRADSSVVGKTRVRLFPEIYERSDDFKRGWLSGYISGDGCIHRRNDQIQITVTSRDSEMLDILQEWGAEFGCELRRFNHKMGGGIFPTKLDSEYIEGVQCTSGVEASNFLSTIRSNGFTYDYAAGWLAGIYDSDGTLDVGGDCRIFQSQRVKPHNTEKIKRYLDFLNIGYSVDEPHPGDGMLRFCVHKTPFITLCRPMMDRKNPTEYSYKSLPKYEIDSVSNYGEEQVYDLTTECHSFIVENFIVHNCESGRHGVIWDRLTRYEPLEMVEEQIKEVKALGYDALAYYDDILPLNKKRTQALMEIHKKYGMIWRCFLRSDIICKQGGYDYLKDMRDGGLVEIFVGVESASNDIKNNITKKTTIEQDESILEWCKMLGIKCKMSFIFGLPGESVETMRMTRDWILKHRPDRVQVGRLIPFKGTPLGDHPENYDIKYETQPPDEWFYRGNMDADAHSFVSTSNATLEQIDKEWRELDMILDREGISK